MHSHSSSLKIARPHQLRLCVGPSASIELALLQSTAIDRLNPPSKPDASAPPPECPQSAYLSGRPASRKRFKCSQSPVPDQLGTPTSRLETRINLGFAVVNAHRQNREQRQKYRETDARNGTRAGATLTGKTPETAPTLALRAGKSPTENGWALGVWWSWGDLNPRPQAFFEQIYMFSGLI